MKKLILIIVLLPLFAFSQYNDEGNENYVQITMLDGQVIECFIQSENEGTITYYSWVDKAVKTISRDSISDFRSKIDIPYKEQKRISKEISRDLQAHKYQNRVTTSTSNTTGNYLVQAGENYLWGVGLGIAGSVIISVGSTNTDKKELVYGGAALALSGFVCTIIGHTKLIKAGKALNKNKSLSLHPSTSGLGLALKF